MGDKEMPRTFKYRRGAPDRPGWWWIQPDKEYAHKIGCPTEPRIIEVKRQGDIIPQKPELYMQYPGFRLEAWLFEGKIAGPIPQPTA